MASALWGGTGWEIQYDTNAEPVSGGCQPFNRISTHIYTVCIPWFHHCLGDIITTLLYSLESRGGVNINDWRIHKNFMCYDFSTDIFINLSYAPNNPHLKHIVCSVQCCICLLCDSVCPPPHPIGQGVSSDSHQGGPMRGCLEWRHTDTRTRAHRHTHTQINGVSCAAHLG